MINRVDPTDCGCTDCLTGYSKPFNYTTPMEKLYIAYGTIENASEYEANLESGMRFNERKD